MLLIPQDHTLNYRNPPRMVLGLCLLLGLIFGFWHTADVARQDKLDEQYKTTLMPIEWNLYDTHLLKKGQAARLKELQDAYAHKDYATVGRQLGADRSFVQSLNEAGQPSTDATARWMDDQTFSRWQSARGDFDPEHNKLSAFALGLSPQQFRPITFISYQLVPQNLGVLLINVLLLVVAGVALELVLGGGPVLAAFLTTGAIGGVVFLLANGNTVFPLATASVGTAGVVGMFVMHFRQEKLLTPQGSPVSALIVPGVWLLGLVAEFFLTDETFWLLLPPIVGLAAGPAVLLAYDRWFKPDPTVEVVIEEPTVDLGEAYREQLGQALQAVGQFNFVDAKKKLRELVQAYPQDLVALRQLYLIEKLEPRSDSFEAVARRLFTLSNTDEAAHICLGVYRDYMTQSRTKRALDTETCLKLVLRFSRLGEVQQAERLMQQVLEKPSKQNPLLPKAALALAQALEKLHEPARARSYREMAGNMAAAG